jgi:hypothetical protein
MVHNSHGAERKTFRVVTFGERMANASPYSVVSRFFAELKDAPSNPSLALCTSTVLFVLSQDRLNMDMDRDSLGQYT